MINIHFYKYFYFPFDAIDCFHVKFLFILQYCFVILKLLSVNCKGHLLVLIHRTKDSTYQSTPAALRTSILFTVLYRTAPTDITSPIDEKE